MFVYYSFSPCGATVPDGSQANMPKIWKVKSTVSGLTR